MFIYNMYYIRTCITYVYARIGPALCLYMRVRAWGLTHDVHGVPDELTTIHDVNRVDVIHNTLLATKGEQLVVWNTLDGTADIVADAHGEIWVRGIVLPRHRLKVKQVHITEGLRVVSTSGNDKRSWKVRNRVVEPWRRPMTFWLGQGPGHRRVFVAKAGQQH